jgi:hypothetical protein
MLIPPGALDADFPAVTQTGKYVLDVDALPALKVTALVLSAPNTADGYFNPTIDSTAFPGDSTLAKPIGMRILLPAAGIFMPPLSAGTTESSSTMGDLPDLELVNQPPSGFLAMGYVIPFSPAINPAGYSYQTFGSYLKVPGDFRTLEEGYFSAGIPTLSLLPSSGTAAYAGKVTGSLVDAPARDPGETVATVTATVNFAAGTVTIATTGTTSISNNADPATSPAANPALDFNGVLVFAPGSNTFSGPVSTANGMTGNVTGRFYGLGIPATTPSKAVGSPPELGGTFAVFATGVGAMQGAFGGK